MRNERNAFVHNSQLGVRSVNGLCAAARRREGRVVLVQEEGSRCRSARVLDRKKPRLVNRSPLVGLRNQLPTNGEQFFESTKFVE